jgi:hypothetical protein
MLIFAHLGGIDCFFFRLSGPGLGNSLIPWARAIIYNNRFNIKFIEPTWKNIKFGTFYRGEKDKRLYINLFNKTINSISGLKKIYFLIFYKKIYENDTKPLLKKSKKKTILIVKGLKNYFEDLKGYNSLIKISLLNLVKKNDLKKISDFNINSISMHIRRSDFKIYKEKITRDEWFIKIIKFLNKNINKKIYIFSDAQDLELKNILKYPNVQRLDYGSSILDLLAMSKSKLFVGSKSSTFSHWVSYLGLMPTIWPLDCEINKKKKITNYEIETDGNNIPKSFVNLCKINFVE